MKLDLGLDLMATTSKSNATDAMLKQLDDLKDELNLLVDEMYGKSLKKF